MGVFYISGLNPFRWTNEFPILDPNINSLPSDNEIDLQNYAVPIQETDTAFPALILLSDYPDMKLEFFTCHGVLIGTETLGATSSSIVNQTFLQYLSVVNFSAFPYGRCFGRISYDANLPGVLNGKLIELLSTFIDGDCRAKIDGISVFDILSNGIDSAQGLAGKPYEYRATSNQVSTALNPRIRLTVTRILNGTSTVIFDYSEVQTGANDFAYSGIIQPGATYSALVTTDDTAIQVAPIDIPDDTPVPLAPQSWITCPIDVQANHPGTQLMQYQNSYNTESVLFHPSNLILHKRFAGNFIGGYQPKAVREEYEDQPYNPVLLNGNIADIYTHYLGDDVFQFPDWEIKKLNLIWAKCDQVKIDYDFYVAQSDFKNERPIYTFNRNGYNYEMDLRRVEGYQFGQLTAGTTPTGDLIVVRKTWPSSAPFPNFTDSFAINGVFTQYSTIDYFETVNPDLSTFILKIGTTLGGNEIYEGEIGTPNADASVELIETHRPLTGFNAPTSVYVTLPPGSNVKIIFVYDQLDSPPVTANPGASGSGLPQGTIAYYKELVAGYFTRDWDIATGLGQIGSLYEGCRIYDEAAGKVLVAWDRNTIDPDLGRGTPGVTGALSVGNPGNVVEITRAELPAEGLELFADQANNTPNDKPGVNDTVAITSNYGGLGYEMHKGTVPATKGRTANIGGGASLNIGNDGLIVLCYIKL